MLDWFPLDPLLDATFRHGSERLPYYYGLSLLYGWNVYKWDRNRKFGKRRDGEIRQIKDYLGLTIPMAEFIKSPNYTKGRYGRSVKKVVVHSMAGYMQPSIDRLCNPKVEASIHYCIGHDGREVQLVDEANSAWHCGAMKNRLLYPFNNADTVGIETEGGKIGNTVHAFGDAGRKVLGARIAEIHRKHGLGEPSSKTVVMHRDMPGTATECPTGVNIMQVIQDAQDAYNNRVNVPVRELDLGGVPVPPVPQNRFQPFLANLEPSQTYRAEVRRVQEFLVSKRMMTIAASEYGYYGKKTQAAIDKFQKANGIPNASKYGWWYDATRAKANNQLN